MTRIFAALQQSPDHAFDEPGTLSPSFLRQLAVSTNEEPWDVRRVIEALKSTTDTQRRWVRTVENLEDVASGLIVRDHIVRAARSEGLDTTASYRRAVKFEFDTYLMTTVEERLRAGISFPDDSLRSYYNHNRERFTTEPMIRLSAILLESRTLADSVGSMLRDGASFAGLAKLYSIQRGTAGQGGDVGEFSASQVNNLQAGLSRMAVGQWAGPFTQDGRYLFVQCTARTTAVRRSYEECAAEISEHLAVLSWPAVRAQAVDSYKKNMMCRMYPEKLMAISVKPPKR